MSRLYARRLDLAARLAELAAKLGAVRDAFEGVQDAVDLPGLLTWRAELARVVAANLAAEMRGCARACQLSSDMGRI